MNVLTFPRPLFAQTIERLWRRPEQPLFLTAGTNHREDHNELLAGPQRPENRPTLEVRLVESFSQVERVRSNLIGLLEIGNGSLRGLAQGFLRDSGNWRPVDQLRLVGAGMHVIPLLPESGHDPVSSPLLVDAESRTSGALGLPVLQRLCSMHIGVIGVGRTGTPVAQGLARIGIQRVTLIDRDILERHNLLEVQGIDPAAVGRPKVQAVGDALKATDVRIEVTPVEASITHLRALQAVRRCDALVCCCDHDGARLAATILASLFHKLLIDVATGIHHVPFRMAADVRVIIPGSGDSGAASSRPGGSGGGCLLCCGGLSDEPRARAILASADAEEEFYANRNWRRERAGSLASLNQVAVGLALRGLEDVVGERVEQSFWAHGEFDDRGRVSLLYPPFPNRRTCACEFSGLGESGLRLIPQFLSRELHPVGT